ncbi:MAG: hypothetical protein IKR69_01895 [Bacteroidales bacterium]|nr:hypothetical protein [Bacteroidales bacterium]
MKPYLRTRRSDGRKAEVTGLLLTVGVHAAAALLCVMTGLKYLDPPPPETSFVVDFTDQTEEPERIVESRSGRQPQADEVDRTREVELVQRSESPYLSEKPNLTPATKPDAHGDVDVPTPPVEEPKLDPRATFPGMSKKDTTLTSPHSAKEGSDTFKAGQATGNTKEGRTEGAANAHLQGRSVMGTLPKPAYNAQTEGIVVVQIKVDSYGTVTEAIPGVEGTTVTDKSLWNAARGAALKAHFNPSADAPPVQIGTITYKFKLK